MRHHPTTHRKLLPCGPMLVRMFATSPHSPVLDAQAPLSLIHVLLANHRSGSLGDLLSLGTTARLPSVVFHPNRAVPHHPHAMPRHFHCQPEQQSRGIAVPGRLAVQSPAASGCTRCRPSPDAWWAPTGTLGIWPALVLLVCQLVSLMMDIFLFCPNSSKKLKLVSQLLVAWSSWFWFFA